MSNTTISVKNISKIYQIYDRPVDRVKEVLKKGKKRYGRDHYALKDVSFEVKEGEILGIIGENGCGKSTLLKVITGVLNPTHGEVEVKGKISALLELGAGFNPEYTGIENIYFNGLVMGFSRKEMEEKVDEIIDFADIGEYINQPVKTYSSGMLVRLAYAVAVSIEPDILIVDEALAVGDVYFQMKSMTKMEELFRKGKTVLFVSHDTASVRKLCNTAIYLDHGQIIAKGTAKEVVDIYEAKARETMSSMNDIVEKSELKNVSVGFMDKTEDSKFIINEDYINRVKSSREGNGKAWVSNVELLNGDGMPLTITESCVDAVIRICIVFEESCCASIGYHIRDSRNEIVLGSNTVYEEVGEIKGDAGDRLVVEFTTGLPLKEGRYNIMTVMSSNVIANRMVEFVDVTKDGFYFDVLEKKPNRIWNMVQLPNSVKIERV